MEEERETFRLMLPRGVSGGTAERGGQGGWEARWYYYGWHLSGSFPGNPRKAKKIGQIRRRSRRSGRGGER